MRKKFDDAFETLFILGFWGLLVLGGILPFYLTLYFISSELFGWVEDREQMLDIIFFYFKLGSIPYAIVVIFSISSLVFQIKSNLIATKRKGKKGYRLRAKYKKMLRGDILNHFLTLIIFPIFWIPLTVLGLHFWFAEKSGMGVDGLFRNGGERRTLREMIADSFFGRPG